MSLEGRLQVHDSFLDTPDARSLYVELCSKAGAARFERHALWPSLDSSCFEHARKRDLGLRQPFQSQPFARQATLPKATFLCRTLEALAGGEIRLNRSSRWKRGSSGSRSGLCCRCLQPCRVSPLE